MEVDGTSDVVVPLFLHGSQPDHALRGTVLLAQLQGIAADEQQLTYDLGHGGEAFDDTYSETTWANSKINPTAHIRDGQRKLARAGVVRLGQTATIKVDSFPYTRYEYLTGTVATISSDAAQDEKMGLVFPARVRIATTELNVEGVPVWVTPGMGVTLEIKTGGRRLISYVISPLRRAGNESGRER